MENIPIIKLVPPQVVDGKTLYAHSDGYFMNQASTRLAHSYTPNRKSQVSHHKKAYPKMRHHGNRDCHFLMVCAFIRIPDVAHGEVIDHINGDVRNYALANLRIIDRSINFRDGGFLRKLRNQHIDPGAFFQRNGRSGFRLRRYFASEQEMLLRYFDRMAAFKASHTRHQYTKLTHDALLKMLVEPEFTVGEPCNE